MKEKESVKNQETRSFLVTDPTLMALDVQAGLVIAHRDPLFPEAMARGDADRTQVVDGGCTGKESQGFVCDPLPRLHVDRDDVECICRGMDVLRVQR